MVETVAAPTVQVTPSPRRWTREEYSRMIDAGVLLEGGREELIAGEIVVGLTQNGPHATAVGLSQDALAEFALVGFHVRVQLPLGLGADSEPEPDLAVVRGARRDYRSAHPESAALVIDVADTSLAFDRSWKAAIYACAGIADYWLLNLVDRLLEVYRDPAPDAAALLGFAYRQRLSFGPDDRVTPLAFPNATIVVSDLLP